MIYHGDALNYINETPAVLRSIVKKRSDILADVRRLTGDACISRLIFLGTGSSYNAAYAAALSGRKYFGTRILVLYPVELKEVMPALEKDALIAGISQQGTSTAVIEAIKAARAEGFHTIAVTGEEETPLKAAAEAELFVPCGYEDAGATTKGYAATELALMILAENVLGIKALGEGDLEKICDAMENGLAAMEEANKVLAESLAEADELIIILSDPLKGYIPEIVLKFSEMCRIAVRGYTADEFVHGIYNSVTDRSTFLFLQYGSSTLTEERLKAYYQERGYRVLLFAAKMSGDGYGLELMPVLMRICVLTSRKKGIDLNIPKDPAFHSIIGSKIEANPVNTGKISLTQKYDHRYTVTCRNLIRQINDALERKVNLTLKDSSLTSAQINVLSELDHADGHAMSLRQLQANLRVAQSTTTGLVSRLAAKGLVEITIDPEDRRIHVVSLTSEGKLGGRERCRNIINAEEALLKCLSPDEREMFRTLLSKVYEALE